jgi:Zn-finger nucleic acid-binding protein
VVQPWRCPIDGRVLRRSLSLSQAAWCSRCSGVWLPRPAAAAIRHALGALTWTEPASSILFDVHRCPEDLGPLRSLAAHPGEIEGCEACNGLWLSGGLLREYQHRSTSAGRLKLTGGAAELLEAAPDVVGLVGSAAEAVGMSAADVLQAISDVLSSS